MKKKLVFLILLAITANIFAQSKTLCGSWLLTQVKFKSGTAYPYQIIEFNKDGKLLAMGYDMGTWKLEQDTRKITLKSEKDKDFNGTGSIITLTPETFVMQNPKATYYYKRIHPEQIARNNKTSPLAGTWKLSGTDYGFAVVKFTLPKDFKLVQSSAGETDRSSGTWMFLPDEQAVIFIGFSHLLRGKAQISAISADGFTLALGKRTLKAKRVKEAPIERLTFSEDDFPEDAEPDPSKLPWQDFDQMAQFLSRVATVQYSNGILLPELNLLKHTSVILSKIQADPTKPKVTFTNLLVSGTDSSQFSEKYRDHLAESDNAFFPKEEPWTYRINGTEKITVPAGTFACTVIEAVDGEKKTKYWMINDMPGLYAKIIMEETDPFGELSYRVQELQKINYREGN